jgi:hypothetical protein
MTSKLKVTASPRGGVESNRKRIGSPQDDELDSAGCGDELASVWRSLEITRHAGNGGKSDAVAHPVVGGGMSGSLCEISGETCRRGDGGRSQRPNSTDAAGLGERRGQQNHAEGSWSGRERKERRIQVTDERKGTECQSWLSKFPMTGRSVLQTCVIDLKPKGLPADGSGNGIGGASLRYSTHPHRFGGFEWIFSHDAETLDWRAVCGRTARTVLRSGRARAFLYPYLTVRTPTLNHIELNQ